MTLQELWLGCKCPKIPEKKMFFKRSLLILTPLKVVEKRERAWMNLDIICCNWELLFAYGFNDTYDTY